MGNSLRCCLACVLPCGALDLIRIVHLSGYVEELPGPTTASRVLQNYPNHVLTKPCQLEEGRRVLILSPDSELKRGSIYFLIPSSSLPGAGHGQSKKVLSKREKSQKIVKEKEKEKEKSSSASHRRKATVGVWRPNLRSISED